MTDDGHAWEPLEVDKDFIMDPSTYGSFRYSQIMRWEDRYFLGVSISSLSLIDLPSKRAEAMFDELLQEGTQDV